MTTDPRAAAIVESTINLAHALGMHVVAEGVETDPVRARLADLGCELAQGFLFCPAMPADQVPLDAGSSPGRSGSAAGTAADGSVRSMVRPLGLPFDPIERAGETWEQHFGPASAMRAATSVFRVQQILLARFDEVLKPHELTFARYEVLVLLTFSRSGELPLKVIGSRLMVHPTSVTNAIDRLVAAGYVDRRPNPNDGRGVLAGDHRAGPGGGRDGDGRADRPRLRSRRPARGRSRRSCSTSSSGSGSGRVTWPTPAASTRDSWTSYYLGHGSRRTAAVAAAVRRGGGRREDPRRRLHHALRRRGRPRLRPGRRVRGPGLRADRLSGRVPVHPRPARRAATAGGPGPSASSPASATRSRPTSATR